jgi:hypothetical protein
MNRFTAVGVMVLMAGAMVASGFQGKGKAPTPVPRQPAVPWARTNIGSSEMTVEFPGPAKATPVVLPTEVKRNYDILETISYSKQDFAAFGSYAVLKAQKPVSLDGAARGALDRVKGQAAAPDYKESITNTTVVGLPGRKIQCSFTVSDQDPENPQRTRTKKLFLLGVIFTDRTRMWQVICTGEVSPTNTALSSRVVASVKRSTPGTGAGG